MGKYDSAHWMDGDRYMQFEAYLESIDADVELCDWWDDFDDILARSSDDGRTFEIGWGEWERTKETFCGLKSGHLDYDAKSHFEFLTRCAKQWEPRK